jgi:hypothetical protein
VRCNVESSRPSFDIVLGIFGQYVQDNITVKAGIANPVVKVTWKEESAGRDMITIAIQVHLIN